MKTKKIHYSVSNGGDGSAYPIFFYDRDCADIHQELEHENGDGWGEDCTGYIEYTGDAEFKGVKTREEYIAELEQEKEWSDEEGVEMFEKYIKQLKKGV
jgi:hypothetical protein